MIQIISFSCLLTFSILAFGQNKIPKEKTEIVDDIIVYKENQQPVTGTIFFEASLPYPRNLKQEYNVVNGILDGEYRFLYGDGSLSQLEFYKNGKKVGPRRRWWMNGNKMSHVTSNKATYWHKNGQMQKEEIYEGNQVVSSKCWDEIGQEIDCTW